MHATRFSVLASALFIITSGRTTFNNKEPEPEIAAKTLSNLLLSFNHANAATDPRFASRHGRPHALHSDIHLVKKDLAPRGGTPLRMGAVPIEKRTDFGAVLGTASSLCLISGMLNVIAFMDMGIPCTHHTGSATHIGRLVGTCTAFGGLTPGAASVSLLALVAAYVAGAGAAGFAKCDGEKVFAGKTSRGLLASAFIIAAGVALRVANGAVAPTLALWSFSQGLQNAISTSAAAFVGFPVRTTHVTGAATDLGSGLGQWLSAKMGGKPLPSLRKQTVFAASMLFFGLGGFIARFLQPIYGSLSALLPAALLALLAIGRPFGTTVSDPAA